MNFLETSHYLLLAFVLFLGLFLPRLEPIIQKKREKSRKRIFLKYTDSEALQNFLEENCPYYSRLDSNFKEEFRYRIYSTIKSWRFYGMEGLVIQDEHRWLIGMSAVQLNFGLSEYRLPVVKKVAVFPEAFSGVRGGLYNFLFKENTGVLEVSIKAFQEGFKKDSDAYNPGLHAMSSVMASVVKNHFQNDRVFEYFLPSALEFCYEEYQNADLEKRKFFSDKKILDEYEFLAIAIEHFFEQSAVLKVQFPSIYQNLCLLHQQDPLNQKTNYLIDTDFNSKANQNKHTPAFPIGFYFLKKGTNYKTGVILGILILFGLLPVAILAGQCGEAFGQIILLNIIGGFIYSIANHWSRFFFPTSFDIASIVLGFMEGSAITVSLIFIIHFGFPTKTVEVHTLIDKSSCLPECVLKNEELPEIYRKLSLYKLSIYTINDQIKKGNLIYFDMTMELDPLGIMVDKDVKLTYSGNSSK